jgi:uncharacterized protein YukE
MAGLSVPGDPGDWLDAGRAISTLMGQLETELSDAHSLAGPGMANAWYGPASARFAADWSSRQSRYEELIDNAQRAAQAISQYGQSLADMAAQAVRLADIWQSSGLHVLEDAFVLPPGIESMAPHDQVSLRQALSESATDLDRMWDDGLTAVKDLAVTLGSVIAELEDFGFLEVGFLAGLVHEFGHELRENPFVTIHDELDAVKGSFDETAKVSKAFASRMGRMLRTGDPAERSVAGGELHDAGQAARFAGKLDKIDDAAAKGSIAIAGLVTAGEVFVDGQRHGYRVSFEQNAGNIAEVAVTAGIIVGAAVLAPETAIGVGGVVAGAIVAIGVGYTVQGIVDHRKAVGHFLESVF